MPFPNFALGKRQRLLLFLLGLLLVIGVETILHNEQQRLRNATLQQQLTAGDQLRARLEKELNIPLYLTASLASYLSAKHGQLEANELKMLLAGLVRQSPHIRNIGIAPANRISYIYPEQGNEQALNLYYPDLPAQWPAIEAMIAKREARLSGPIELVQGGRAFIYRYPIFLEDDSYWGIVSTVVNIEQIWQLLTSTAAELDLDIALREVSTLGEPAVSFFGDNQIFSERYLTLNMAIRGAEWQMAIREASIPGSRLLLLRLSLYSTVLLFLYLLSRLLATVYRLQQSRSALTESEQRLRSIHDNVLDGIITIDQQGIIQTANHACYRIFGYTPPALVGQHWRKLLSSSEYIEQHFDTTTDGPVEYECQGQRADGHPFELLLFHTPLSQQNLYKLFVLRDITARKRTERLQNDFVATVSHELRTPLTAINGALGLAMNSVLGPLTEQQLKMLHIAQQNCRQLHQLVNDLLDFEKLSSGKMAFKREVVDLSVVVQPLILQLSTSQQRAITLEAETTPPYLVIADEVRLRQVCSNLLSNALKFSDKNSTVTIRLQRLSQQVLLQVIDEGKGVPAAFEPMLFQRFAQADNQSSRAQGGTGLGLAISKELTEKMRGEIGYQRLPNGSCFYVKLPAASI
ncbi:MAG: histidine kinase [Alishewanella sp. 34-51-39]|nr:MAG: histidine kinase [Alishewanella sp. 34-51-39]